MALSARDRRIITALEHGVEEHDPEWARRFVHRHRRGFGRLERRRLHATRRRVLGLVLAALWVALMCVDDAHGPGPWLWAALAASAALLLAFAARGLIRRRRCGQGQPGPG